MEGQTSQREQWKSTTPTDLTDSLSHTDRPSRLRILAEPNHMSDTTDPYLFASHKKSYGTNCTQRINAPCLSTPVRFTCRKTNAREETRQRTEQKQLNQQEQNRTEQNVAVQTEGCTFVIVKQAVGTQCPTPLQLCRSGGLDRFCTDGTGHSTGCWLTCMHST